jgi:hypothetical protein
MTKKSSGEANRALAFGLSPASFEGRRWNTATFGSLWLKYRETSLQAVIRRESSVFATVKSASMESQQHGRTPILVDTMRFVEMPSGPG